MVFDRLAIHGLSSSGDQPFVEELSDGRQFVYMCNGEIYNYRELAERYNFTLTTGSDCEVIGKMFSQTEDFGGIVRLLDGEFSIVGVITKNDVVLETIVARDPFGVRPLFYTKNSSGVVFSSTVAGCPPGSQQFPPGEYWRVIRKMSVIVGWKYYTMNKYFYPITTNIGDLQARIVNSLVKSVRKRLDSERPIGFLLSGGLDSSLVVSIAARILGGENIQTFSVGMHGSSDLLHARKVADALQTRHTEVIFTPEEGIAAIPDVIRATETYDITTIRASVGQFLLAKYISEKTDIKVILNGDGADEAQMGYLYFYGSPTSESAYHESHRLLRDIHYFDGLRVDRTLGWHGLEARVPFLDPEFIEACMTVPLELRVPTDTRMEKYFIRHSFKVLMPDCLPQDVLWRKKEAFSDGVSQQSKSWYQVIQDALVDTPNVQVPGIQPHTPESSYYRSVFDTIFPDQHRILPYYWMPKWSNTTDPSARTLTTIQQPSCSGTNRTYSPSLP
jgi:asparagine synthase (glutamine-hydrolysing)